MHHCVDDVLSGMDAALSADRRLHGTTCVPQDTDRRGEGVSEGGEEVRDGPNCRRENVSVDFSRGHYGAASQQDGCVVSVGRNRARVRDWIQVESLREGLCAMCSEDVWCFGLTKSSLCDSRVVVYKNFEDHYYEKNEPTDMISQQT